MTVLDLIKLFNNEPTLNNAKTLIKYVDTNAVSVGPIEYTVIVRADRMIRNAR